MEVSSVGCAPSVLIKTHCQRCSLRTLLHPTQTTSLRISLRKYYSTLHLFARHGAIMASESHSQALTRTRNRSPSPSPSQIRPPAQSASRSPSQISSEERAFLEDHSALLVARSYEQACEVCEIQTFHVTDSNCIVMGAIDDEFNELSYTNKHFEDSMPILADNDQRLAVVRISRFFVDDRDLIYYVQGKNLIPKLMEGVFGRQCFTGPMFGCPVKTIELTSALSEVMSFADNACKVFRMTSHMEGVKWRYFFETGRVLWSRLKIDTHKLRAFRDDYEDEVKNLRTSTKGVPGDD
ncbi:hypothetical protein FB567DRAFT_145138 [Paraphoma chrysanthemicola]|uniref:Uncharacterized protein n=1 Tax=Paraphoma chrysanthemicola TaxID=798071 RepID=A0A8K0QWS6_9PLEO|nr:hypothetical protein FB567DRAFT_145138 [Paraphoma chrysanthemicola]